MLGLKKFSFFPYFFSWLPIFYYWANLYRMFNYSAVPYVILSLIVGLIGLFKMFTERKLDRKLLVIIFFLYGITGFFNYGFIENVELNDVLSSMVIYGIFIVMIVYPFDYYQGLISFAASFSFFFSAYLSGAATYLMLSSSGNYVSVLLILGVSLYYIGLNNSNKPFLLYDIIPAALCFWMALWARGRGGILSTGFLLLLTLIAIMKQSQMKGAKLYKIIIFIISIFIGYIVWNGINLIDEFFSLGKFGTEEFDTPRPVMWASYFTKMFESPLYILLGSPLKEVKLIHSLSDNCHNSFLQLHAYNGIIIFCGFVYFLIKSILYMYENKLYALLMIALTIVVRGMTDKFIFGQYGMPIMLFLTFYPFVFRHPKTTT